MERQQDSDVPKIKLALDMAWDGFSHQE